MACTRWITDCFRSSGSTEEERIPLMPRNKNAGSLPEEKKETDGNLQTVNYHAIEIALTENQLLLQEVEASITKKMRLAEHPPFVRRHCCNIFSFLWISALLATVADLVCHAGGANHVTQQKLDQYTTDHVEPLWLALPAGCTQKVKKYLESPDECVRTGPKFAYADGGATLINFLLNDPNLKFCNDDIITLFRKCEVAPHESIEFIKNLCKNAWKEQLIILFLAGLLSYLHYLKQKQYDRDTTWSPSDINNLNRLTQLEKEISGIFFTNRHNQVEDMKEILFRLELIKFSQGEINKYQKYIQARKTYLESIFPAALVETIIDGYLSHPVPSAPKYHSFSPDWWKKSYAAFFGSLMGEQETVVAKHDSRLTITFSA